MTHSHTTKVSLKMRNLEVKKGIDEEKKNLTQVRKQ